MVFDYSIIIPAYNEESWLPETLAVVKQAMAAQSLSGEVVVVDNNSTDTTAAVAEEAGARVIFEAYNQISRARNRGAAAAKGRYMVFVDADTHISPELLNAALSNLESGHCCGGGARVAFDHLPTTASSFGLSLWNSLSRKLHLAAGCFVYIRRDTFDAVGGFSQAVYASEEIWLSRQARSWGRERGKEFCIIDDYPAISSGRKLEWFGVWQQTGLLLLVIFFPFFVRFRRLCNFWYSRPE